MTEPIPVPPHTFGPAYSTARSPEEDQLLWDVAHAPNRRERRRAVRELAAEQRRLDRHPPPVAPDATVEDMDAPPDRSVRFTGSLGPGTVVGEIRLADGAVLTNEDHEPIGTIESIEKVGGAVMVTGILDEDRYGITARAAAIAATGRYPLPGREDDHG